MKESDLQPPKPLWHEDTRGRPGGGRGVGPAGPLSSAAHRMLNHSMQVLILYLVKRRHLAGLLTVLACRQKF